VRVCRLKMQEPLSQSDIFLLNEHFTVFNFTLSDIFENKAFLKWNNNPFSAVKIIYSNENI